MDRTQLIEDAAKAIYEVETEGLEEFTTIDPSWEARGSEYQSRFITQAEAALAVFERAYTPTECLDCGRTDDGCDRVMDTSSDDEREALVNEYLEEHGHHADARHGFLGGNAAGLHRTMQGEPSDAQETLLNDEGWPVPSVVDVVMERWSNDNYTIRNGGGIWNWRGLASSAIQSLAQARLLRDAVQGDPPESDACPECGRTDGTHKLDCGQRRWVDPYRSWTLEDVEQSPRTALAAIQRLVSHIENMNAHINTLSAAAKEG